ncbi:MAG: hypothetical protein V4658_09375 [Bacteroidota bacterium]
MPAETKNCLTCGNELHGRSDKKFCDDQCRTTYNNRFKTESAQVKSINSILRKNRKILEGFLLPQKDKTTVNILLKKLSATGFNFTYSTHLLNTKNGNYTFCYEYGYRMLDDGFVMIVKSLDN